jgi:hypothetical protein
MAATAALPEAGSGAIEEDEDEDEDDDAADEGAEDDAAGVEEPEPVVPLLLLELQAVIPTAAASVRPSAGASNTRRTKSWDRMLRLPIWAPLSGASLKET